jgi:hypothetical protein
LEAEAWSAFTSGLEISASSSDESVSESIKGPRAMYRGGKEGERVPETQYIHVRDNGKCNTYIAGDEMELTFRYLTHNVNGTRPCINMTMNSLCAYCACGPSRLTFDKL